LLQNQTQRITELCTINNTLSSKVERQTEELKSSHSEIEMLQALVEEKNNKMAKARELSRRSVVGVEAKLERIAADSQSQVAVLQSQLADEVKLQSELREQLREFEGNIAQKEAQVERISCLMNSLATKPEVSIPLMPKFIIGFCLKSVQFFLFFTTYVHSVRFNIIPPPRSSKWPHHK
jgi:chromosome segregation ATPase